MNNKELELYLEEMRKFRHELSESPEKSLQFLIDAGILDKDGNLMPQYDSH